MKVRLQWSDRSNREPIDVEFPAPPVAGDVLRFGEAPNDFDLVVFRRRWDFDYYGATGPAVLVVEVAEA
jgi:hypothetical protein